MDRKEILKRILIHYNFKNQKVFARHIGTSAQNITNWLNRGFAVKRIIKYFPELNINWLETGNGDMFVDNYLELNPELRITNEPESQPISKPKQSQNIPLYNLGTDHSLKTILENPSAISALSLIRVPDIEKCDGATYVQGNSMSPALNNGDIILFKNITPEDISSGELYLIEALSDHENSYLTIRYIHKSGPDEDFVKITSNNPDHKPQNIAIKNINAIALIKACIQFR